jgi:hypothetical protein
MYLVVDFFFPQGWADQVGVVNLQIELRTHSLYDA